MCSIEGEKIIDVIENNYFVNSKDSHGNLVMFLVDDLALKQAKSQFLIDWFSFVFISRVAALGPLGKDHFLWDRPWFVRSTEQTDREAQAHTAIVFLAPTENISRQWV